mgnify:CR=1 FL=1
MTPGLILTRLDQLVDLGFVQAGDVKKSVLRTRQALDAKNEMNQPDHPIRLKAADQFFKLVDLYPPKQPEPVSDGRPIAVTIVLTGADPRAELQAHGVRLHLSSNGDDSA